MLEKLKEKLAKKNAMIAESNALFEKIKLSEDERNQRFDICLNCEFLFKPTNSCKKCGCFMSIKTYMPKQSCPIGKWDIVEK